jgi:hypothetical protein
MDSPVHGRASVLAEGLFPASGRDARRGVRDGRQDRSSTTWGSRHRLHGTRRLATLEQDIELAIELA